jgi:hypothetical protein
LAIAGIWLYYDRAASQTVAVTEQVDEKARPLRDAFGAIQKSEGDMKKQEEIAAPLLNAIKDRQEWTTLFNEIHSRLPKEYVWVTSFEKKKDTTTAAAASSSSSKSGSKAPPDTRQRYLLKGLYLENPADVNVTDPFVEALNKSKMFEVDKTQIVRKPSTGSDWAYEFSFPLIIKDGTEEARDKEKEKAGGAKKKSNP